MLRRPKKKGALLLSRHGLTIRKLTFRCVHIPAGPQKEARACVLFVLYSLSKNFFAPPQKGESGCKGKAFSRFPPNIRGTFFRGKGRGTKTPRRPCRKRVQKYAFRAERQTKRGIFFTGKRTFFAPGLEYRGLRGTRGAGRGGTGRGTHIYIIYIRRGKGGEKARGRGRYGAEAHAAENGCGSIFNAMRFHF